MKTPTKKQHKKNLKNLNKLLSTKSKDIYDIEIEDEKLLQQKQPDKECIEWLEKIKKGYSGETAFYNALMAGKLLEYFKEIE